MDDTLVYEQKRIEELYSFEILDTQYDSAFQNLVKLAASLTELPCAAITFVDSDRVWYKATHNLPIGESPRLGSFCQWAMDNGDDVFEVPDLKEDSRFSEASSVKEEGGLRFYAGKPLVTRNGYHLGTICVLGNFSHHLTSLQREQLKMLSEQVVNLIELKKDLQEERGKFGNEVALMSSINHEIRTPINAIIGYVDILKKKQLRTGGSHSAELDSIGATGDYLAKLVNNSLDYHKLKAGKGEVQLGSYLVSNLLKQVQHMVSHLEHKNGTSVKYTILDSVPECLEIDNVIFKQVAINLISNAIKFTPNGEVEVSLDYDSRSGELICDIIDNGMGMSSIEAEKVFTPYSQCSSAKKTDFKGSGLGLSISRELVRLFDGEIDIVSTAMGLGTHVRFSMLVEESQALSDENIPKTFQCFEDVRRILVVDDAKENLFLFKHYLNSLPYSIEVAQNREEALALYSQKSFDYVFLDIDLGNSRGEDLLEEMKGIKPSEEGVFIAFTGSCTEVEITEFLSNGFDRHVAKPFCDNSILSAMH